MQGFELTPQQRLAAQLLATGMQKALVASEVNVTRRTLYSWEQRTEFKAELASILKDSESSVRLKLRSLCSEAVTTLQSIMNDPKSPAHVRAGIAYKILELILQDGVSPLPVGTRSHSSTISPEALKFVRQEIYGIIDDGPGLSDAAAATLRAKFLGLPDA